MKPIQAYPKRPSENPAAFRRLCVETLAIGVQAQHYSRPAAFRRLCVETTYARNAPRRIAASRLQAAVC